MEVSPVTPAGLPARSVYVTTPIYYVNDRPHIGHCYTTLVGDCLARFARLRSPRVFFLTGTDEHADKVVTTAKEHNLSAIQWADRNAEEFRKAFAFIHASNDDFIRTTQPRHTAKVTEYVTALMKSGAIYKGQYTGWYDENQEEYLTETVAKEHDYKSPVTGRPLVQRSEVCYFFRLSTFQQRLEAFFAQHPDFVRPQARRNEVLGRLREGLQDVPVSRPVTDDPATQFGVRVPGDPAHRVYVWIDALFNYLSVVDTDERRDLWPAPHPKEAHAGEDRAAPSQLVHLLAKDILWFHAVIWPAMLLALRDSDPKYAFVGLPSAIYSHAYWVREGRKMSKSLKNFIEIEQLQAYAGAFSLDALRWYLLTQGPLSANDADFSHAKFVEVYNADLANGIGNCASRVSNMIEKYFAGALPAPAPGATHVHQAAKDALDGALRALDELDIETALERGVALIRAVDLYINETQPFKLAKTVDANPLAKVELATILATCAEAIRIASVLLSPACPDKMAQLQQQWGCTPPQGAQLEDLCAFAGPHSLKPGQRITKGEALFQRADPTLPPPA